MDLYVTIEPRTLREAIERAFADSCSCVVSVTRESAADRWTRAFWERAEAKRAAAMSMPRKRLWAVK